MINASGRVLFNFFDRFQKGHHFTLAIASCDNLLICQIPWSIFFCFYVINLCCIYKPVLYYIIMLNALHFNKLQIHDSHLNSLPRNFGLITKILKVSSTVTLVPNTRIFGK
jgi:hypothetical protein